MSADFWAGYISGAVGIVIGNPLDLVKVRLQAGPAAAESKPPASAIASPAAAAVSPSSLPSSPHASAVEAARPLRSAASLVTGAAAPILGYGALNALLFVSYNRAEAALGRLFPPTAVTGSSSSIIITTPATSLWTTWLAGCAGGLATWVVSTPTELVKCRAQLARGPPDDSSWRAARHIFRREGGLRGFYFGGAVTAARDGIGYGFYFWAYELCTRWWMAAADAAAHQQQQQHKETLWSSEAARVLLCGGVAGVVTWASVFPLDVVKTRVQAQVLHSGPAITTGEAAALLGDVAASPAQRRKGAVEMAREAYREGGVRVFFRGLTVCSVRAFIVNAVQWAAYEWIMRELGQGRAVRDGAAAASAAVAEMM
ncbi:uncharacterized protein E0L32_009195 [Thyridium curvatum]|uniref:Mitochondrial carrier protein n=1 Tax=Thyridium curvatum TaxID=1093900 RepID=A0A507ASV6_9PEZI|nr:uncharacterized protein E0L32_009195 [Thyridium curvatum]TPX09594.1 hypothetical protein E0L32_009195 [Thyridium curvatum]